MSVVWQEFLDKCEFVYLTEHSLGLPWEWLQEIEEDFVPEVSEEAWLLKALRESEEPAEEWRGLFQQYLRRLGERTRWSLPKIGLRLCMGDPVAHRGQALICPGEWDVMGEYVLRQTGVSVEASGTDLVGSAGGEGPYRRMIFLPEEPEATPKQLRLRFKEALDMAYFDKCQEIVATHVPSARGQFADDFAAAELVGASRLFLMQHPKCRVRLVILRRRLFKYYERFVTSLGAIRVQAFTGELDPEQAPAPESEHRSVLADLAQQARGLVGKAAQGLQGLSLPKVDELFHSDGPPKLVSTFEVRQSLAYLEFGEHEKALSALGRFSDSQSPWVEYLKGVILYDRNAFHDGPDEDRILGKAIAARGVTELAGDLKTRRRFQLLGALFEAPQDEVWQQLAQSLNQTGLPRTAALIEGWTQQQERSPLAFEGTVAGQQTRTLLPLWEEG